MRARTRRMLEAAREWLERYGFVATVAGVALVSVLAAVALGATASARADAWREREAAFERLAGPVERWSDGFESAAPAESASWRRSARELRTLVVDSSAAATVAAEVARSAERLGVLRAGVRLEWTDTLAGIPPVERDGPPGMRIAPIALHIELEAGFETVVRFIGALPPAARVRELELTRIAGGGGAVGANLLLTFLREESGSDVARGTSP